MGDGRLPPQYQAWIEARRRFRLSAAQLQMARELGMNPRKFGKLANHDQEVWKLPLPQFIESLYFKRFGRDRPAVVLTVEEHARQQERKKAAGKAARKRVREESQAQESAQAVVDAAMNRCSAERYASHHPLPGAVLGREFQTFAGARRWS